MSLKCNLSLENYIIIYSILNRFASIEGYKYKLNYIGKKEKEQEKENVEFYKKFMLDFCKKVEEKTIEERLKDLFSVVGIDKMKFLIKLLLNKSIIEEKDLRDFINKNFAYFISGEMRNDEKAIDAMNLVFEEVHNKRGVDFSEIKYLNRGGYKIVYLLETENDKVIIKMGSPRYVKKILYTSKALYPVFYREINSEFEIEITEFAEDVYLTFEQAYQFYKEERDKGIVITDIHLFKDFEKVINLGRLTKPNCIHYLDEETGEPIYIDPRSVGFEFDPKYDEIEIQDVGTTVLRDLDFIYRDKNKNICWYTPNYTASIIFEERYQNEMKKKIIKSLMLKLKRLKVIKRLKLKLKRIKNRELKNGNRKSATTGYGSRTSGDWEHVDR